MTQSYVALAVQRLQQAQQEETQALQAAQEQARRTSEARATEARAQQASVARYFSSTSIPEQQRLVRELEESMQLRAESERQLLADIATYERKFEETGAARSAAEQARRVEAWEALRTYSIRRAEVETRILGGAGLTELQSEYPEFIRKTPDGGFQVAEFVGQVISGQDALKAEGRRTAEIYAAAGPAAISYAPATGSGLQEIGVGEPTRELTIQEAATLIRAGSPVVAPGGGPVTSETGKFLVPVGMKVEIAPPGPLPVGVKEEYARPVPQTLHEESHEVAQRRIEFEKYLAGKPYAELGLPGTFQGAPSSIGQTRFEFEKFEFEKFGLKGLTVEESKERLEHGLAVSPEERKILERVVVEENIKGERVQIGPVPITASFADVEKVERGIRGSIPIPVISEILAGGAGYLSKLSPTGPVAGQSALSVAKLASGVVMTPEEREARKDLLVGGAADVSVGTVMTVLPGYLASSILGKIGYAVPPPGTSILAQVETRTGKPPLATFVKVKYTGEATPRGPFGISTYAESPAGVVIPVEVRGTVGRAAVKIDEVRVAEIPPRGLKSEVVPPAQQMVAQPPVAEVMKTGRAVETRIRAPEEFAGPRAVRGEPTEFFPIRPGTRIPLAEIRQVRPEPAPPGPPPPSARIQDVRRVEVVSGASDLPDYSVPGLIVVPRAATEPPVPRALSLEAETLAGRGAGGLDTGATVFRRGPLLSPAILPTGRQGPIFAPPPPLYIRQESRGRLAEESRGQLTTSAIDYERTVGERIVPEEVRVRGPEVMPLPVVLVGERPQFGFGTGEALKFRRAESFLSGTAAITRPGVRPETTRIGQDVPRSDIFGGPGPIMTKGMPPEPGGERGPVVLREVRRLFRTGKGGALYEYEVPVSAISARRVRHAGTIVPPEGAPKTYRLSGKTKELADLGAAVTRKLVSTPRKKGGKGGLLGL